MVKKWLADHPGLPMLQLVQTGAHDGLSWCFGSLISKNNQWSSVQLTLFRISLIQHTTHVGVSDRSMYLLGKVMNLLHEGEQH